MGLKEILTKNSPEFGSKLAFNAMITLIAMFCVCTVSSTTEGITLQWAMMAGGLTILVMIAVCFAVIYFRKDVLLIGVIILLVIIILLCVAAVINESYYLYSVINDDSVTVTWWTWVSALLIIVLHIILAILSGGDILLVLKLKRAASFSDTNSEYIYQ
mmetsp:Transcript_21677/g.45551  ORF Transcript_21677/g.45551 Transcript_21677/m.45551 type:complete len:159 (+) Transcript_21677:17-493(+)